MPRSTTASLMASVSVARSAMSPSQMNTRLIALNIGFLLVLFRFFFFQQNFLCENEFQLLIELSFVCGADDCRAKFLHAGKQVAIDVERHEVDGNCGSPGFRILLELRHSFRL